MITRKIVLAVALLGAGCNNADFGSATDKGGGRSADGTKGGDAGDGGDADRRDSVDDGSAGGKGNRLGGSGKNESSGTSGEDSANSGGDGPGTDGQNAGGGQIGLDEGCLAKKADTYNIVLVFDASTSQKETDEGNLRIAGGKDFAAKLARFGDKYAKTRVNVAVVAFNKTAWKGGGWFQVKSGSLAQVNGAIEQAMNLGLGTHYIPALDTADSYLADIGAAPNAARQRNYVVFMTDGEPNLEGSIEASLLGGEQLDAINSRVDQLVQARGVAMITVATGSGVKAAGDNVLQGMAKPNPGIVSPKHVGRFRKVATQGEMEKLGEILASAVSECE